jgi:predicted enzyme related to lactoylglutathione lyase
VTAIVSYASIIADDIGSLCGFYGTLFELDEVPGATDIYRGLRAGNDVVLAFSAPAVYGLLGLDGYTPASGTRQYLTFEVGSAAAVEELTARAVDLGATVLHEPYTTSYAAYQAVLADPEGNAFRLNHDQTAEEQRSRSPSPPPGER